MNTAFWDRLWRSAGIQFVILAVIALMVVLLGCAPNLLLGKLVTAIQLTGLH